MNKKIAGASLAVGVVTGAAVTAAKYAKEYEYKSLEVKQPEYWDQLDEVTISNAYKEQTFYLSNEDIRKAFVSNKAGELNLDLSPFTFAHKHLSVSVKNTCGTTVIKLPKDVEFIVQEINTLGDIVTDAKSDDTAENSIFILVENTLGQVTIVQ